MSQTRAEVSRRIDGVTGCASKRETNAPDQTSNQVRTQSGLTTHLPKPALKRLPRPRSKAQFRCFSFADLADPIKLGAVAKKLKSLSEAETARRRAVTGLRNLGRYDEVDRYESMSAHEYAEDKGIELVENPFGRRYGMARQKSSTELRTEIAELKEQVTD